MQIEHRIGVALGGGGVAGLAAIGVLETLGDAGIPIHCIAGTSAGAAVGAAFATGKLHQFADVLSRLTPGRVLARLDPVWHRGGLVGGRRAVDLIEPFVGQRIEDLGLPFAAVAADLSTGEEVVLDRGSVPEALRASMALPGLVSPSTWNGRLLADGGLVNPVPVSVARRLGATFVIAVTILPIDPACESERAGNAEPSEAPIEVPGLRDVVAMGSRVVQAQIARGRFREDPPECLICPHSTHIGLVEFGRVPEAIDSGRAAARAVLADLRAALEPPADRSALSRLAHAMWPPQAPQAPLPKSATRRARRMTTRHDPS